MAKADKLTVIIFAGGILAAFLATRCGEPDALRALEESESTDVQILLLTARLYEKQGAYEKAEKLYGQIFDLEPGNVHFGIKLAEMLIHTGKREKALETLKKIAGKRANSAETLLTLVRTLKKYGFDDEAVEIAKKAGGKFKDYRFAYTLAQFAESSGERKSAIAYYFDALRYASHDYEILLINESLAGGLPAEFGIDGALADLQGKSEKALRNRDFRAVIYLNLLIARIASENERIKETRAAVETVWREHERAAGLTFSDLPCTLGQMLERVEAWEAAVEIYQKALDEGTVRPRHIIALGRCCFMMDDKASAAGKWRLLVEGENSKYAGNYILLIDTLLAHGMSEEAGKAAEEALRKYPKLLSLVNRRLGILLAAGEADAAVTLMTETMFQFKPRERSAVAVIMARGLPRTADLRALIRQVEEAVGKTKRSLTKNTEGRANGGSE